MGMAVGLRECIKTVYYKRVRVLIFDDMCFFFLDYNGYYSYWKSILGQAWIFKVGLYKRLLMPVAYNRPG